MIYVGIDIGLDGGMAALDAGGNILSLSRMPLLKNVRERREVSACHLSSWLISLSPEDRLDNLRVMLEYVHSFGHESRSSMFSFGRSDGKTRAALEILQLEFADVDPRQWKNAILPQTNKDKVVALRYCQQRWGENFTQPFGIKLLTDGIADALCIAQYGRSHHDWSEEPTAA